MQLAQQQQKMEKDLRTVALFVGVYCRHCHAEVPKQDMTLKNHDMQAIAGRSLQLCENCRKLLAHGMVKRSHCPMSPKPACKHCPSPCYHPAYRRQMREVMKYSGRRMLLSGRLDYLFHLLF